MAAVRSTLSRSYAVIPWILAVALIVALVLTPGCTRPKHVPVDIGQPEPTVPQPSEPSPPPHPVPGQGEPTLVQGTKERPALRYAEVGLCETHNDGGRIRGDLRLVPGSQTTIGIDESSLHIALSPAPDQGWVHSHVKVQGAVSADAISYLADMGWVSVRFSAGKVGDAITVSLDSVTTADPAETTAVYGFRRLAEPRATLSAWTDGKWCEVDSLEVLPQRPLRLRLSFTRAIVQANAVSAVTNACPGATGLDWLDDRNLVFEAPSPPPVLRVNLDSVRDCEGLWVLGGLPVLFTGEPPQLLTTFPGAAATRLCALPPNIETAIASPGGEFILVACTAETTGWPSQEGGVKLVVDVRTGRSYPVEQRGRPVGWVNPDTLIVVDAVNWYIVDSQGRLMRQGKAPGDHAGRVSVSPDGTRLASLHLRYGEWDEQTYLYPADLAITDLKSNQTSWVRDFVSVYRPPTDWISFVTPVWSADSSQVAGASDLPSERGIRVADLDAGVAVTAIRMDGDRCLTDRHLSWAPNGRWWLLGDELIDARSGPGAPRRLTGGPHDELRGRHLWSPDSRHVAYLVDWGLVVIVATDSPAATHVSEAHYACGWSDDCHLYVISWADHMHRYDPESYR